VVLQQNVFFCIFLSWCVKIFKKIRIFLLLLCMCTFRDFFHLFIWENFFFLDGGQFGENIAKHYFCKRCGVYPFHAMRTQPGKVRINLACVEGIDSLDLAVEVFDGAGLSR